MSDTQRLVGIIGSVCAVLVAATLPAAAADAPGAAPQQRVVAAEVDDWPIYVDDVERHLQRVVGDRPLDVATRRTLLSQTLTQLIDRQLVLGYLKRTGGGLSPQEVDLAVARLTKSLAQQNVTLAEHLEQQRMTERQLRRDLAWQLGWPRYVDRHLTDENLQRYFARHRRDFDGTELRVAHLLLRVAAPDDESAVQRQAAEAGAIRQRIAAGEISFADAARQHSDAPTAEQGGAIGWIQRRRPMPESFSRAAFALDADEVSEPVVSAHGVHLIRCLEVRPGQRTWQQARGELGDAVRQYLFRWAADQQRSHSRVLSPAG